MPRLPCTPNNEQALAVAQDKIEPHGCNQDWWARAQRLRGGPSLRGILKRLGSRHACRLTFFWLDTVTRNSLSYDNVCVDICVSHDSVDHGCFQNAKKCRKKRTPTSEGLAGSFFSEKNRGNCRNHHESHQEGNSVQSVFSPRWEPCKSH